MTTTTELNLENARYYDHALNSANAATGSAIARARRSSIDDGTAFTVIACWSGKTPFYWNGCYYDALGLAKSILFNGGNVRMIAPSGSDVNIAAATY